MRCRELDIFWEDFLEEFFGRVFFGGIFLEEFFGRIVLGGFFWEDFLGGIFWEEFFGRNSLFTLLKSAKLLGIDFFLKILVFDKILSKSKKEGIILNPAIASTSHLKTNNITNLKKRKQCIAHN